MKRIISAICVGTALLFVACGTDTEIKVAETPYISLSSSSITLSAEAVSIYTINYTIGNPVDYANVLLSANVSWISNFDNSISGQVRFDVAENTSNEFRTGVLTVAYTYNGGSVTSMVAVTQYGVSEPVLSVNPAYVTVSYMGAKCDFSYVVENDIEGESVRCSTTANWISSFDYDEYGTVAFTVMENEGEELRTGVITVSYADLSKEITVVQDHSGGSAVFNMIGTYTCSGRVYGYGNIEWTVKVFEYEEDSDSFDYNEIYDFYIDGLANWAVNGYDYYGDHRCSAAAYMERNGTLHIPTQIRNTAVNLIDSSTGSEATYYLGFTPCVDSSSLIYSEVFPDLVFKYNESGDYWESTYGIFMCLWDIDDLSFANGFLDCVYAPMRLVKTSSSTTSLSMGETSVGTSHESPSGLEFHTGMISEVE